MRILIFCLVFFSATVLAQKPTIKFLLNDTIHAGDSLNVKVTIKKTGITGFAKLEVYVPPGFTPLIDDPAGATVVYREDILKFIWIEITPKSELEFYIQFVTDRRLAGIAELYGRFHYLYSGKRKNRNFPVQTTYVNNKGTANFPYQPIATNGEKIPLPETIAAADTFYRVQIGAFKKRISKEILTEFYPDETIIFEEKSSGYFKYTIGNFSSMPQATEFRNICGVRGAFIVKYIKGVRN